MPTSIQHSKVVLYADGTALFVTGSSVREIETKLCEDMASTQQWLYNNKFTLNTKKIKSMLFGTSQKLQHINDQLEVRAGDDVLEQVQTFKYLGLWFDPSLTWAAHVDAVSKKISQRIGMLYRLRQTITTDVASILFKSLIQPIID